MISFRRVTRHLLPACLLLTMLTPVSAEITDTERDILQAFYEAANGDEWFRNDGWLQPGSDPCDWYGVECRSRSENERDLVHAVELPGNSLSGTLDTRIFEIVHDRLDLSDNELGGTLDRLPASPGRVDLSNNLFDGSLPAEMSAETSDFNWYLDLSGNDFEGEVPEGWDGPKWLSLANNRLEGMPGNLLEDAPRGGGRFLDLSDNQFSGALPTSLMEGSFMPHNGSSRWGGGLNLCWNDWAIPENVEFREWLEEHHVAGEFENCLSGERQPINPAISGSWFDPDRSGEGIVVHTLDNGTVLNYFFTFDENGKQQWLVGAESADEDSVSWRELLRTRGQFDSGLLEDEENSIENRGSFRIDRLGSDRIMAERVYIDETSNSCVVPYPLPLSCYGNSLSDRREYQRLSSLAGTSCANQSTHQEFSGAWYNPERSGEGFILEVLPDDRAVIYWFTYTPDDSGQQAWIVGVGEFESGIDIGTPLPGGAVAALDFDAMVQPVGTAFGPDFDSSEINNIDWGSLRLAFHEDGSAKVSWDSELDGYGSGESSLEHLAQPMLAECD
ncbi:MULTISPECIES: hypothetical protein [unclassified Wenzhouxiangella]|uniref:hypothetical protein n=1 Tax=unclassified Wenzhouxiangella TaxID=2613841 RepID=UPI000E328F92|nr:MULTISPECIES: hypothetical protein [unclassified Wenzhouxiangella]RFF26921.1 hypothetical protein DZK25_10585 [Wenzhouxiangella sp. 15181]RFP68006.1 hypothetical protein DZK26_10110 [Wenzhouxiangella sp. 15190]